VRRSIFAERDLFALCAPGKPAAQPGSKPAANPPDSKSAANPATQQPGNTRQNRKTRQPGSLTGQIICEDVRPPTRQFPATQQ
jgi:hypothetical protein